MFIIKFLSYNENMLSLSQRKALYFAISRFQNASVYKLAITSKYENYIMTYTHKVFGSRALEVFYHS